MHIRLNAFLNLMAALVGMLLLTGCAGASLTAIPPAVPSTLDAQGPFAASIASLAWFLFVVGALVLAAYTGLILVASWRRRNAPPRTTPSASIPGLFIPIAGIAIPTIILIGTLVYTLNTMSAIPSSFPDTMVVEITGHQWWWQVRYPDAQVTTANEIHIPVRQPVEIRETSTDVIHSLWIPQLNGKMDLFPDRQTSMMIQASQPGTYRGECAEFCGVQHARMELVVVADPPDQFAAWLNAQKVIPLAPTDPHLRQGQQAFLGSACVYCHTVLGTNATGTLGPDLTHLASRQTIGAGTMPNSRGNLAGWVVDAQGIKPGNLMPPVQLDADQLQAILDYLESLK
jgi:cytochrome c oxidase subunit 2